MLSRHAFIDLETTGLDPSCDEVIEVGVLFVEAGAPVRRWSQLCRPSLTLPLVIKRLTGLTDHEVARAPTFSQVAPELRRMLSGWVLVAHNAAFERSFLGSLIADAKAPMLDSCELLHYLYPELPSHSLEQLVRWAGRQTGTAHRALSDAEDTFAVVSHALTQCIADGRQDDVADLLKLLAEPTGQLSLESAGLTGTADGEPLTVLLQRLHEALKASPRPLELHQSEAFLPAPPKQRRVPTAEVPIAVDAWLGPDGSLERDSVSFESRPQQLELARAVEKTLRDGGTLAVEAPTGTGKSLGYLAAAALEATRRKVKIAVAPHTRALQDQLMHADLPALHQATGGAFAFSMLKGQSNYFCRRRALELTAPAPGLSMPERAARAYLRAFVRRSPDGDLDKISQWFREHFAPLPALVEQCRSTAATTLGARCPHYARCAYHSAVAHAKAADVVVINQSLALNWPARYPPFDSLVLDEAHEVEDAATASWSEELAEEQLRRLFDRLAGPRGVAERLRRDVAPSVASGLVAACATAVSELKLLNEALASLATDEGGEQQATELRLSTELRLTRGWLRARDSLHAVRQCLDEVAGILTHRVAEASAALVDDRPELERELNGLVEDLNTASSLIEGLADRPDKAHSDELAFNERGWQLARRPVDVQHRFREDVLKAHRSVVLVSATLSTGPESPWVLERLGLTGEQPTPLVRFEGGFDLRGQALVILVTDAPDVNSEAFVEWASQRISGLAQYLSGRVLGLFASARRLEQVAQRTRQSLEPMGIEVMRQSRGSARALAARQKEDLGTVLLGTKSFWQGIDIPGLGVSCVFIDKLPLEPVTRPIVAAREERLGKEPWGFLQYRLPRALLQLRQGVGRLIRSPADRGVVVIADPGNAAYRAKLYDALEGYRVEALPWAQARVRLYQTMKRMGLGGQYRPRTPLDVRQPEQWALFG